MKFVSTDLERPIVGVRSADVPAVSDAWLKVLSGVSLIIPAKNEGPSIGTVIEKALPYCDEIVVVDGHSTDSTAQIAQAYGVRVVKDNKKGLCYVIRVGAAFARFPYVVFMDADGSH